MKINKNDLMSDELGKYTMVNGQKQYVVAKKRKLDINPDSNVGRPEYNGNANIGMDYIKPSDTTVVNPPKELPGRDAITVNKSNVYNSYKPKPTTKKQGGGYVAPIPENIKENIPEDYSKMISYNPGQSTMEKKEDNSPGAFRNTVGGILGAVTEIPGLLGKGIATGVGEIAKINPYADDAKVDKLVQSYKDSVDKDRSNFIGEDQDSIGYKAGALAANVIPIAAGGAAYIGKQGLKKGINTMSAFNNIGKNAGKGSVNINKISTYKGVEVPLNIDKITETGKYAKTTNDVVKPVVEKIGGLGNIKYSSQGNMEKLITTYNKLKEASAVRSLSAGEQQLLQKTLKLMNG